MTSHLQQLADEVADLYARLHVALTPFSGASNSGRPSGKPGSRPPVNLDASDLIGELDRLAASLTHAVVNTAGRPYRKGQPTISLLRRLPLDVESLDPKKPGQQVLVDLVYDQLRDARRDASTVLGMGPARIHLEALCPECRGEDKAGRGSLIADPEEGAVWCRNRACGYECGRIGCWCTNPDVDRKHRFRWGRADLLRFADILATQATEEAQRRELEQQRAAHTSQVEAEKPWIAK